MTQDEIIEMAIEAEFVSRGKPSDEESELFVCTDKDIVRFANLVAAKAIAELESQEPVAWELGVVNGVVTRRLVARPQRKWVGLSDEEIAQAIETINMLHGDYATEVAYAVEASLKDKNS